MEMIVKVKGTTALNINFSKPFFLIICASLLMLMVTHELIRNTPVYSANTVGERHVVIGETYEQEVTKLNTATSKNGSTCSRDRYNPLDSLSAELMERQLVIDDCSTIWIKGNGLDLNQRIKLLNTVLSLETQRSSWLESVRPPLTKTGVISHFHDSTRHRGGFITSFAQFKNLENNDYITTIYLLPGSKIPREDKPYYSNRNFESSYIVKDYFPCTITGQPGRWVRDTADDYNSTCKTDLEALKKPMKHIDPRFFSYHGWSNRLRERHTGFGMSTSFSEDWNMNCPFCNQVPNFLTYVHIIRNAIVLDPTVIYQVDGKMKIMNLQCKLGNFKLPSEFKMSTALTSHYHVSRDVVFSISNHWQGNEGFYMLYHTFGESLTKLSLFVDFLRAHPYIAIHVKDKLPAEKVQQIFIQYWNLTNEIIYGNVFAKVLILPEGNPCFQPGYLHLQLSQQLLSQSLHLTDKTPDSILYVQRTTSREIMEEERILQFLTLICTHYKIKLRIFSDKKVPEFTALAEMFHSAYLTIGAHGAGLTNILFSTRKTAIFEIICEVSPATFAHMSHKLGLRHHAFFGHRVGPNRCDEGITIKDEFADFKFEVEQVLRMVLLDPSFKKYKA